MKRFDIYKVNFPYEEADKNKLRPALVISVSEDSPLFMKITSKGKSPLTHCEITEWQQAGLSKESYIEYDSIHSIDNAMIFEKIGELSLVDKHRIEEYLIYGRKHRK